jgi:hypothetical protein
MWPSRPPADARTSRSSPDTGSPSQEPAPVGRRQALRRRGRPERTGATDRLPDGIGADRGVQRRLTAPPCCSWATASVLLSFPVLDLRRRRDPVAPLRGAAGRRHPHGRSRRLGVAGAGPDPAAIPKLGVDAVVRGTSAAALDAGVGHSVQTPPPCSVGDVALAGHPGSGVRRTVPAPRRTLPSGGRVPEATPVAAWRRRIRRCRRRSSARPAPRRAPRARSRRAARLPPPGGGHEGATVLKGAGAQRRGSGR